MIPTSKDLTNFFQGNLKHLTSQVVKLPLHEEQQIQLRASLCAPCLKNGKCLVCNCKTPEMFYAPQKVDSRKKFAQFFNREQWEALVKNIDDYYKYIKNMEHPQYKTYFKDGEFDSPDLKGSGATHMQKDFLYKLTETRIKAGIPFHVTSGYRTPTHNKKVGGESNSAHTKGYASDIRANNSAERFLIVQAAIEAGFTRIGIGKTYVHLDNDPTLPANVMWDYYDK